MGVDDIDIYDANLRPLGRMDWMEAHQSGQWHRTFHCWVYRSDDNPRVLFQLRSPNGNFPNMLDVSAAGHLAGGETIDEGIREAREELGIDVDARDLLHIGERVEVADQDNGQHNREYQSVFLLQTDKELAAFRPQIEEVWGLFWIPITDGLALFAGRIDQLRVSGIEYDQEVRGYIGTERTVRPDDFLPRIQRYYMAALIAAQRAVDGKPDIAIS